MIVIHMAGPVMLIQGRIIQRCAICGTKLVDNAGMEMPLNPDGTYPAVCVWPIKRLIEQEDNRFSVLPETNETPDDLCLYSLVE